MNELDFLDLVVLKKVDADSSVEKFGSAINTSFFETANLLGTIKIKGYVNIESSVGGISRVILTDAGSSILAVASQKATEPIEPLDNAILHAVASGTKEADALRAQLNIRSADLAFHINKLVSQGFMDYEVRSAKVSLVLSEQGFNATGGVRVQQTLAAEPASSPLMHTAEKADGGGEGKAEASHSSMPAHAQQPEPAKEKAPPWVAPSLAKAMSSERKEDVKHLIGEGGEGSNEKQESKPAHHAKRKGKQEKELTPEERLAKERHMRMVSKLQYYFAEYAPYILLLFIVAGIFIGAIYLAGTRLL